MASHDNFALRMQLQETLIRACEDGSLPAALARSTKTPASDTNLSSDNQCEPDLDELAHTPSVCSAEGTGDHFDKLGTELACSLYDLALKKACHEDDDVSTQATEESSTEVLRRHALETLMRSSQNGSLAATMNRRAEARGNSRGDAKTVVKEPPGAAQARDGRIAVKTPEKNIEADTEVLRRHAREMLLKGCLDGRLNDVLAVKTRAQSSTETPLAASVMSLEARRRSKHKNAQRVASSALSVTKIEDTRDLDKLLAELGEVSIAQPTGLKSKAKKQRTKVPSVENIRQPLPKTAESPPAQTDIVDKTLACELVTPTLDAPDNRTSPAPEASGAIEDLAQEVSPRESADGAAIAEWISAVSAASTASSKTPKLENSSEASACASSKTPKLEISSEPSSTADAAAQKSLIQAETSTKPTVLPSPDVKELACPTIWHGHALPPAPSCAPPSPPIVKGFSEAEHVGDVGSVCAASSAVTHVPREEKLQDLTAQLKSILHLDETNGSASSLPDQQAIRALPTSSSQQPVFRIDDTDIAFGASTFGDTSETTRPNVTLMGGPTASEMREHATTDHLRQNDFLHVKLSPSGQMQVGIWESATADGNFQVQQSDLNCNAPFVVQEQFVSECPAVAAWIPPGMSALEALGVASGADTSTCVGPDQSPLCCPAHGPSAWLNTQTVPMHFLPPAATTSAGYSATMPRIASAGASAQFWPATPDNTPPNSPRHELQSGQDAVWVLVPRESLAEVQKVIRKTHSDATLMK